MKKILSLLALTALTIGLLGSCKKEDPKVSVTGVTLDKTTLEITVGDPDVKLTATVAPDNATEKSVNWSSNAESVATVDASGKVTAVAPGDATITVTTTDGGKTATCVVKVKAAVVPVSSVALDKTELTLTVGDPDVKLVATVAPDNATDKTVNWASDKAEVATVDDQGNVHAVTAGTANITVTTTDGGKTATCAVKVKAALPANPLPGEFSVSTTKKVHFSKGNLWADGSNALHFEDAQWKSASAGSKDASHVSHFTWSDNITRAVSDSNSGDNLFCDESHKVSVDGGDAIYYALSKDEWIYLFNNHTKGWASVNGKIGYVIAPDGFTGNLESSYADDAALASAGNLVFLPAAGYCSGSNVDDVGGSGHYWSSTVVIYSFSAYDVVFDSNYFDPGFFDYRSYGLSVRLVTDVK